MLIVYAYGCKPPLAGEFEALTTLRRAHRYRNRLVEISLDVKAALWAAAVLGDEQVRDQIPDLRRAEQREARAQSGLHYGTYLLVEAAAKKAKRFSSYRAEGRIGAPCPTSGKRCTVASAMAGTDSNLQIVPRGAHYLVRLRQGDWWLELPVKLHRMPPLDAIVLQAWVQRSVVGSHAKWELRLVLDRALPRPARALTGAAAGIDLGWRRVGELGLDFTDGIRVAASSDGEGFSLPRALIDRYAKARSIESIRQREFNAHKPIPQMMSANRLAERVRNGEFVELEAWRKQDRHLRDWHEFQERSVRLSRREHYRQIAQRLCKAYDVIYIEKFDLRRPACEKISGDQRFDVSPSEFRNELRLIAANCGTRIVEVPAEYTTIICHECGCAEPWAKPNEVRHCCERCGAVFDADVNAAKNIKARGLEVEPLANEAAE